MARISKFRLGVAAVALMVPGAAWAQSATVVGCAPSAANGVDATCSGTATNQNGANGYGTGAEALTVRIDGNTTVSGDTIGIALRGGSRVLEASSVPFGETSTIRGTSAGIAIGGAGSEATVVTLAFTSVSATGANGRGISLTDNSGSIWITGPVSVAANGAGGAGIYVSGSTQTVTIGGTSARNFIRNDGGSIGEARIEATQGTAIVGEFAAPNTSGVRNLFVNNRAFETITGATGISFNSATENDIYVANYGTITGTGGTAIDFGANGGTLQLGSLATINGRVIGSQRNNTLVFGVGLDLSQGTLTPPTDTFDFSLVNNGGAVTASEQFVGFNRFRTARGNITVTGGTGVGAAATWDVVGGAGTTTVNGNLSNVAFSVAADTALGGTGSVGSTTVSGTLTPGGDGTAGTLTVNGDLVFSAGSTFRVDVGATQGATDRVIVSGTATLAGSLAAFASGGVFTNGSYTLLTANGGISGTFSNFSTVPATSTGPSGINLRYGTNDVVLDVALFNQGQTFTMTSRESLVFTTPTVTTNRVTAFSTQIIGRLLGGAPLYDQTFAAAFTSAQAQNGVTTARAAITTAGGPGVIIGDPVRTSSNTTSSTVSNSLFTLAGASSTEQTVVTFGPDIVQTGPLSLCNVSSLPSSVRPSCTTSVGTTITIVDGTENFNTITDTVFTVAETRTDTITETLSETYEITGQVAAVGSVHAEVQSGLFDLSARLLGRLNRVEAGSAGWADVYGFRVNQGGRRSALGLAGGVGIAVAPGLTLAFGIDRGRIDVDVASALESGRVELTEIGASLRYDTGRFTASLALVQGFGNASTRRAIFGSSTARYDVRVTGAALDLGYALNVGNWTLRPEAGIDWVRVSTSAFAETDTLGLIGGRNAARQVRATAGLSIGRDFGKVTLSARARYLGVLEGSARRVPVAFALAPSRALTMTSPGEPDGALLGARIAVPLSKRASFSVSYDGRLGGGYTSHAGTASLRVAF